LAILLHRQEKSGHYIHRSKHHNPSPSTHQKGPGQTQPPKHADHLTQPIANPLLLLALQRMLSLDYLVFNQLLEHRKLLVADIEMKNVRSIAVRYGDMFED